MYVCVSIIIASTNTELRRGAGLSFALLSFGNSFKGVTRVHKRRYPRMARGDHMVNNWLSHVHNTLRNLVHSLA